MINHHSTPESIEAGARLKQIQKIMHLKAQDIADLTGFAVSTIYHYRSGERIMPTAFKELLKERLNINLEWLSTGEGKMFNHSTETMINEYKEKYRLNDTELAIINNFLLMSPDERNTLLTYVFKLLGKDTE